MLKGHINRDSLPLCFLRKLQLIWFHACFDLLKKVEHVVIDGMDLLTLDLRTLGILQLAHMPKSFAVFFIWEQAIVTIVTKRFHIGKRFIVSLQKRIISWRLE
jgi:hypothetical protein